jgi:hypothetical protein
MLKRRLVITAALVAAFAARDAHGDIYHLKSPSKVETEKGSKLELPPGYFLDEETWRERDEEMRRLQEREKRRAAANKSLRKSADDYPWLAHGVVGSFGIAAGVFCMAVRGDTTRAWCAVYGVIMRCVGPCGAACAEAPNSTVSCGTRPICRRTRVRRRSSSL